MLFFSSLASLLVITFLRPLFTNKIDRELPHVIFTTGEVNEENYWYYYFLEFSAAIYGTVAIPAFYCMFLGLILRVSNQFDILTNKLTALFEYMKLVNTKESFNENEQGENIIEVIQQHQKIFE